MCKDDFIEKHHLSKRIRTAFMRENLYLFDGRPAKKPDDLIFCNVRFDNSSRTYCYLADIDEYEEGDQVVVLAGEEKRETIVTIVSIQYLPAEKAP